MRWRRRSRRWSPCSGARGRSADDAPRRGGCIFAGPVRTDAPRPARGPRIPLCMTATPALTLSLPAPAARWTLVATSFGLGMALLDVTAVNVAIPSIEQSLQTDVRGLSWVIDGYTLTFASLLLLAGGLGDRLGAKRVFTSGFVLFTAASALCGAAPALPVLVFARILQGVGAALFIPSSL